MENLFTDLFKRLEVYINSREYKVYIKSGDFSGRFTPFMQTDERYKDILFMLQVLKDEVNSKHELLDLLEEQHNGYEWLQSENAMDKSDYDQWLKIRKSLTENGRLKKEVPSGVHQCPNCSIQCSCDEEKRSCCEGEEYDRLSQI